MTTQEQVPQWSRVLPHTAKPGVHGDIRRNGDPFVHAELGVHGCRTAYEAIRRGGQINPLGPCLGFRAVSTSGFATPYIYSSYTECIARIDAIAAGLQTMKLVTPNQEDGIQVVGLYLKNCVEWVLCEHAAFTLGACTAPFYDTLGPSTVQFILEQTSMSCVVTTRANLPKLCQAKQAGCPQFLHVILVDGVTAEASKQAQAANLQVYSLAKVEATGTQCMDRFQPHPPAPSDICTFCYTSGTTGNPKGALLTHENLISAAAGIAQTTGQVLEPQLWDRHLSYMPLAHIMERLFQVTLLGSGASIAFFRGDPLLLIEDWQACRPTLLIAPPRVLNKIYDKIQTGISAAGGLKKKLFDAALASKTQALHRDGCLTHAIYDRLIFNKIKAGLGMDQVRVLLSGSAPLAQHVMMFFRCLLGIPVVEGYGQTEGAAAACISHPDDVTTFGHVGGPVGSIEMVLYDVPEMGYLQTDTVHESRSGQPQPCCGRGEICLRGPSVFAGYYKDPDKTKEAIDSDGWLHSGDIGLWRPDGALQIIDRKKNIFKLSQGEYVAPEKIENILTQSALIAQCFVYGDSLQNSLVAIVVPDEEPVKQWAARQEQQHQSLEQLCRDNNKALNQAILDEIRRLSKENGLQGFEMVKAVYLESTLFDVESDLLTPTLKLKRQIATKKYHAQIADLYASLPPPRSKL